MRLRFDGYGLRHRRPPGSRTLTDPTNPVDPTTLTKGRGVVRWDPIGTDDEIGFEPKSNTRDDARSRRHRLGK